MSLGVRGIDRQPNQTGTRGNTLPIREAEGFCWVAENAAALRLPLGHLLIYGAATALICLGSARLITSWVCGGRLWATVRFLFEFIGAQLDKLGACTQGAELGETRDIHGRTWDKLHAVGHQHTETCLLFNPLEAQKGQSNFLACQAADRTRHHIFSTETRV